MLLFNLFFLINSSEDIKTFNETNNNSNNIKKNKNKVLTFEVTRRNNTQTYRYYKNKLRFLENEHLDSTVIYGNTSSMNYYYVDIYIGTPLKKQTLIIDTGSGNTGVPCKSMCSKERCGPHLNSYYDPDSN